MENWSLAAWLVVWIVTVCAIFAVRARRHIEGGGLLVAYLLNLFTIHWLGASIYLLPWFPYNDPAPVEAGFAESTYGVAAFAVGSLVLAPILMGLVRLPSAGVASSDYQPILPRAYIAVGVAAHLLLSTDLGAVRTMRGVLSAGQQLLVVGLCLACWRAWEERRGARLVGLLGMTALLPFATIVNQGFLAYGAVAALIVYAFVASFARPRWKVALASVLVAYVGLSFYVTYMRDRGEIREAVWGGRPLEDRVTEVFRTVSSLEWFDPFEIDQLWHIDRRLNQNVFVGVAINRLSFNGNYAFGETIVDALAAVIPRTLWPEKPQAAGSGGLVAEYTGFRFAEGTSVGIGQVMEFYINFGTPGVIVGFMLMGVIITVVDAVARQRLVSRDLRGFALWYLPGISFLQVGGSLVEVTGTAAASVVAVVAVNWVTSIVHRRIESRSSTKIDRASPSIH